MNKPAEKDIEKNPEKEPLQDNVKRREAIKRMALVVSAGIGLAMIPKCNLPYYASYSSYSSYSKYYVYYSYWYSYWWRYGGSSPK